MQNYELDSAPITSERIEGALKKSRTQSENRASSTVADSRSRVGDEILVNPNKSRRNSYFPGELVEKQLVRVEEPEEPRSPTGKKGDWDKSSDSSKSKGSNHEEGELELDENEEEKEEQIEGPIEEATEEAKEQIPH